MTVLIVYGTVEGQSAKIARFIKDVATKTGFDTQLIDTGSQKDHLSFEGVDTVFLVASVHERRHPKPFEVFIGTHRSNLVDRRTMLLSVSLKAAFPEGQEEAQDYLAEMMLRTHFEPNATALVAGAVRPGSYDYFEKEIVRHVVLNEQHVDLSSDTQEFTDWAVLEAAIVAFLNQ